MFFLLEIVMAYKDFGGVRIDIATNLRIMKATIFITDVVIETITYKCIERTVQFPSALQFMLKKTAETSRECFNLFEIFSLLQ